MRLFRQVVFDAIIYDNIDAFTSDEFAALFTMADQLTVQAVVDNVREAGGRAALWVDLETSNDGRNWAVQASPIDEKAVEGGAATSILGSVTDATVTLCMARLRIRGADFGSAHLKITISARGKRDTASAAIRRPAGSDSPAQQANCNGGACGCSSKSGAATRRAETQAVRPRAGVVAKHQALSSPRKMIPISDCNIGDPWTQAKCKCTNACGVLDDGTSFGGIAFQECAICCSVALDEQELAGKAYSGYAAALSCGVPAPPPLRNPPQAAPNDTPTVVGPPTCPARHLPCTQSCFTLYSDNTEDGELAACISCCDKALLLCGTPGFSDYSSCDYKGCVAGAEALYQEQVLACNVLGGIPKLYCIDEASSLKKEAVANCGELFRRQNRTWWHCDCHCDVSGAPVGGGECPNTCSGSGAGDTASDAKHSCHDACLSSLPSGCYVSGNCSYSCNEEATRIGPQWT